jgi:transcriptional regulator with XRE-family HTH domain
VGIHLSQRQMAELYGITPQELSKIEAGLLPLTEKMKRELGQQRVAAAVLTALAKGLEEER